MVYLNHVNIYEVENFFKKKQKQKKQVAEYCEWQPSLQLAKEQKFASKHLSKANCNIYRATFTSWQLVCDGHFMFIFNYEYRRVVSNFIAENNELWCKLRKWHLIKSFQFTLKSALHCKSKIKKIASYNTAFSFVVCGR